MSTTRANDIRLSRRYRFSASHRLYSDELSEAENRAIFGKCANRQGHGHNYTLEVTVAGSVDPTSGFVVDLKQLKDILEREVVSVYDHRHLNYEVAEFATTIPTTENIAIAIWRRLEGKIPNATLHRVRVEWSRARFESRLWMHRPISQDIATSWRIWS